MAEPTPTIVNIQRVRIIRDIEAAALRDRTGRLPWRASWAAYFGDREGLLDALATRRRCLALIRVEDLPPGMDTAALTRRIRRSDAALERVLRRYGQLEAA
jgi:hypothetical protein